ncbi:MAG: redoxin domain-containing protein [Polyangiaceae bacterium]|nr:redoxin domain-containing protein [Polyangiaceae bacterium]
MIAVGDAVPEFELPSSLPTSSGKPGRPLKLSDLRGKKVVLAFYPLDFSPVCSGELSCFRDDLSQFQGVDTEVVGVSVDSAWCHAAFAEKLGLSFPLVADFQPRGGFARQLGFFEEDKGFTSRATVVVDRDGKAAYVKNHGLGTPRDNAEILAALSALR